MDTNMNDTLNEGYTAVPKSFVAGTDIIENDLVTEGMEYGEMNEADARSAGYIKGPIEQPMIEAGRRLTNGPILMPIMIGLAAGFAALFLLRRRS